MSREAKKQWRELAPKLDELGLLTEIDGAAFAMLCTHWGIAVEAAKLLKKEGLITLDERGLNRKHPAAQILRDNTSSFYRFMTEFGMTPSARTQIETTEKTDNDEGIFDT